LFLNYKGFLIIEIKRDGPTSKVSIDRGRLLSMSVLSWGNMSPVHLRQMREIDFQSGASHLLFSSQ